MKGTVDKTVVRPEKQYGLERVALRSRKEAELELEVAEMKMLKFTQGVTQIDGIRNEYF